MLSALDKARLDLLRAEARLKAAPLTDKRRRLYLARKINQCELHLSVLEREARKGWRMPCSNTPASSR